MYCYVRTVLGELLNNGTFLVQTGQPVAWNFLTEFWPIREAFSWCGLDKQRGKKKAHNRWFQIADQFQLDGTALSGFLFTGKNELQYKDLKAQCSGGKLVLTSSLQ